MQGSLPPLGGWWYGWGLECRREGQGLTLTYELLVPGTGAKYTGLAAQCLTTQVSDQWIFTFPTPEWSDSGVPAVAVTGDTSVINWLVLGLSFLAAI